MKVYSFEHWLIAAAILAFLIAIHWLAFRIGARRIQNSRREPPRPIEVRPRRPESFDKPIPVTFGQEAGR